MVASVVASQLGRRLAVGAHLAGDERRGRRRGRDRRGPARRTGRAGVTSARVCLSRTGEPGSPGGRAGGRPAVGRAVRAGVALRGDRRCSRSSPGRRAAARSGPTGCRRPRGRRRRADTDRGDGHVTPAPAGRTAYSRQVGAARGRPGAAGRAPPSGMMAAVRLGRRRGPSEAAEAGQGAARDGWVAVGDGRRASTAGTRCRRDQRLGRATRPGSRSARAAPYAAHDHPPSTGSPRWRAGAPGPARPGLAADRRADRRRRGRAARGHRRLARARSATRCAR